MRTKAALIVLAIALFCTLSQAEEFSGKVVKVMDGDTISVMRGGDPVSVRLYGIDAPEDQQTFSELVSRKCAEMCLNKEVSIIIRDTDKYQRLVADVILPGGKNLNHEMVRQGYAWWYREYARDDKQLQMLEYLAKKEKTGVWSAADPVAPWEYRRIREQKNAQQAKALPSMLTPRPTPLGTPRPAAPASLGNQNIAPLYMQPLAKTSVQPATDVVYITPTGKKYHKAGCRTIRNTRTPLSRNAAIIRGYESCGICNP